MNEIEPPPPYPHPPQKMPPWPSKVNQSQKIVAITLNEPHRCADFWEILDREKILFRLKKATPWRGEKGTNDLAFLVPGEALHVMRQLATQGGFGFKENEAV